MKKILYVSYSRQPGIKAHSSQVMQMCSALAKEIDVELVVPQFSGESEAEIKEWYGLKNTELQITKLPFLSPDMVYKNTILKPFAIFAHLIATKSFAFSLKRYCKKQKREGVVVYARDLFLLQVCKKYFKTFYEIHIPKRSYKKHINGLAGLIPLTEVFKQEIQESFQKIPMHTEHDAINLEGMQKRRVGNTGVWGYVGKFTTNGKEKGLPEMIEAFGKLSPPNVILRLVGASSQSECQKYKNMAKRAGIPKNAFECIGAVKPNEVMLEIQKMDLCILPLPKKEHYDKYSSSLKLFEYMASGVPMVVTKLTTHLEVVDRSMSYLAEPSAEGIAEAMQEFMSDDKSEKRAHNAYNHVQYYTWEERAKRIIDFIKKT